MHVSAAERAGHLIRVKARALAEATVDEHYRRRPEMQQRYGPSGREKCVHDVCHHLRFLAASVECDSPQVFADYVAWAVKVMAAHRVAVSDVVENFEVLRDAVAAQLPQRVAEKVREHVTEALRRTPYPPASPAASRAAASDPIVGSAPARS